VGSLMVLWGALSILIILAQIIESISRYGFGSVAVKDLYSFQGFVKYFALPFFLYSAGVGLITLRPWARLAAMLVVPLAALIFLTTVDTLFIWLLVSCGFIYYLMKEEIRRKFR